MPDADASLRRPITLRAADGAFIPVRRAAFTVTVDGPQVSTAAEVEFHHEGTSVIEADLVLPLPPFAAVQSLRARWGQRELRATVRARESAQEAYTEAVEAGHAAVLGESEGEDLARIRIAPVAPHDDVSVALTLLHGALATMEGHRVVIPLTYMPRYVEDPAALTSTERAAVERPRPVTAEARGEVLLRIRNVSPDRVRCASHVTQTRAVEGDTELRVTDAPLDRDLIVEVCDRPGGSDPLVALRVARGDGPDGKGPATIATVLPPAFADEGPTTARTVLFLVDRSGSMEGRPMEAAKRAVRGSLRALGPEDRFNILAFDDRIEALAATTVPFTDEALKRADAFAGALDARGGTEASAALRAALSDAPKKVKASWKVQVSGDNVARLRLVVFMTDGDVAGAAEVLRTAKGALGETRVHVLGIGDSVNHALLAEIAEAGGGTYTPVATDEDLERAIAHLKSALDAPLWTGVTASLVAPDGTVKEPAELEPSARFDLFAGAAVTFGWRGALEAGSELRLRGAGPDGATRTVTVPLASAVDDAEAHARWAAMRARRITYRFDASDDEALARLGVDFGILTRRTALVAVDPHDTGLRVEATVPVSLPMPGNVGGELRRSAALAGMAMPMMSPPAALAPSPKRSKGGVLKKAMRKVQAVFSPTREEADDDRFDMMPAELDDASAVAVAGAPMAEPEAVVRSPNDLSARLRDVFLHQRADGSFGDVQTTLAAVAASVANGQTHREGDHRAELRRALAWLRGARGTLSGDAVTWADVAIALLTVTHGGPVENLDGALAEAVRGLRWGDPIALRRSVMDVLAAAPAGWDAGPVGASLRRDLLA